MTHDNLLAAIAGKLDLPDDYAADHLEGAGRWTDGEPELGIANIATANPTPAAAPSTILGQIEEKLGIESDEPPPKPRRGKGGGGARIGQSSTVRPDPGEELLRLLDIAEGGRIVGRW